MTARQNLPVAWQEEHDHDACLADAISVAKNICQNKGVRLTRIRQRVLELVWRSHRPVGAYALLDVIKPDHRSAAPPTIYRALDFLMEQGLVHRIQSLNAYVGCNDPGHAQKGIFLICNECGDALEIEDETVASSIKKSATGLGFYLSSQSVEAVGLCPGCQT